MLNVHSTQQLPLYFGPRRGRLRVFQMFGLPTVELDKRDSRRQL